MPCPYPPKRNTFPELSNFFRTALSIGAGKLKNSLFTDNTGNPGTLWGNSSSFCRRQTKVSPDFVNLCQRPGYRPCRKIRGETRPRRPLRTAWFSTGHMPPKSLKSRNVWIHAGLIRGLAAQKGEILIR